MSSMENRSWTDLSSNVTHFGGVRLTEHLDDLLRPGSGPPDLVLGCLHELAHHWCFHSPVGFAMAGMNYRIASAFFGEREQREPQLLSDLITYRTMSSVLRPLAEGLALFAEFDVNSFKSKILSSPLMSAISLFSGRAPAILDENGKASALNTQSGLAESLPIAVELREIRTSDVGIRRKVNVLATRLDQDADGYLLGYLGVKGMWRVLRQRCRTLYSETDLAFAFLRSFIFEDRGLLTVLLSAGPDDDLEFLAERLLKHVNKRLHQLADVTESDVETFEHLILNNTPSDAPEWASCQLISAAEWTQGQESYQELISELMAENAQQPTDSADEETLHGIRQAFAAILNRRHIVRLGTQAIHVEVDKAGRFAVWGDGRELLSGHASDAVAQSGEGTIELVFSSLSSGLYRAIVIYGPDSLVDIVAPGIQLNNTDYEEELALLGTQLRPTDNFLRLGESIDALVNNYLANTNSGILLDTVECQIPRNVRNIYLDKALNTVADDRIETVLAQLDTGGIYALLGHDRDLLDALVILGAAWPLTSWRSALLHTLAKHGFANPEATLRDLVNCEVRTGMAVANADETQVFTQV